jgi:CRISPR-associated protein Cmr4
MEKTYWLHVISPLHVGAGRGVGYIDLPIMREKATNWPYVPGSAVKGVLRQYFMDHGKTIEDINIAFGQGGDDDAKTGTLVFSDASIVCLPVRSFYGTFAWITSPMVLRRLRRLDVSNIVTPSDDDRVIVFTGNKISSSIQEEQKKVYFEDLDLLTTDNDEALQPIYNVLSEGIFPGDTNWQDIFKQRLAIVHDDIFTFLSETGTEVNARVRIDDAKKTVAKHALWYEEALPVETILAGTVWCDKVYGNSTPEDLMKSFCDSSGTCLDLQIGGKATTGKGRVRCLFS